MVGNNDLFNEVKYAIDVKIEKPQMFEGKVVGFAGDEVFYKKDLFVRKYENQRVFAFVDLLNSSTYTRKEAFDLMGNCFLTDVVKLPSNIPDMEELTKSDIGKYEKYKVWKSDSSSNFVLACVTKAAHNIK